MGGEVLVKSRRSCRRSQGAGREGAGPRRHFDSSRAAAEPLLIRVLDRKHNVKLLITCTLGPSGRRQTSADKAMSLDRMEGGREESAHFAFLTALARVIRVCAQDLGSSP